MSRRRVLNVTSVKKRDNMPCYTNIAGTSPPVTAALSPISIPASVGFTAYAYCPTARALASVVGANPKAVPTATQFRNQEHIWAKGYKEVTNMFITGGTPWTWRRLVLKLNVSFLASVPLPITQFYTELSTGGMTRSSLLLGPSDRNLLLGEIMDGAAANDWISAINAKIDTDRVIPISDRVMTINPGNTVGHNRLVKNWYPLNYTVKYHDDESGNNEFTDYFAGPTSKDVLILDMFFPGTTPAAGDGITINHEGTFYWHER